VDEDMDVDVGVDMDVDVDMETDMNKEVDMDVIKDMYMGMGIKKKHGKIECRSPDAEEKLV
jgi:hypothetical protein